MSPATLSIIDHIVTSLATIIGLCWWGGRLLRYWEARLAYFGPEPVPGISGITRRSEVQES